MQDGLCMLKIRPRKVNAMNPNELNLNNEVSEERKEDMNDPMAAIAALKEQVALLQELIMLQNQVTAKAASALEESVKKNHRPVNVRGGRTYTRLTQRLADWGNIPAQQKALAEILIKHMELDQEYSESEVFSFLREERDNYDVLAQSKQDVTYLFAYYRGVDKKDGKTAGFIRRNFLKVS